MRKPTRRGYAEGGKVDYDPTTRSIPEVVDDAVGPTAKQLREGTPNPRTGKPWPSASPVTGKAYNKGGKVKKVLKAKR